MLTASQVTQVFKIFGIPQSGTGAVVFTDLAPRGTVVSTFDMSQPAARLGVILGSLTPEQEAEAAALLEEWANVTDYSEVRVNSEGRGADRAQGRLADDQVRRQNIRLALGNVLGFYAPPGGFAAVAAQTAGAGEHRLIR
ncbi:MAG: hypothetical protein ABSE73_25290 [Planctomycetota bacterium]